MSLKVTDCPSSTATHQPAQLTPPTQIAFLKSHLLPIEVYQFILSFLKIKDSENCRLISRVFNIASYDFTRPYYQWVLRSKYIQSLETAKTPPAITYNMGSCYAEYIGS